MYVVGVDQLSRFGGGTLPLNKTDWKVSRGLTMLAVYAMRAQRYLHGNDVTPELLAEVSVKNHDHGILSPYAQYKKAFTVKEILDSRMIAEPLTLLQCCPSTADGAASLELSTRKAPAGAVKIRGSVIQSGLHETGAVDMTHAEITRRTAQKAYEQAGVGPDDLNLVETHDAFTISELLYYEALGLCEAGGAAERQLSPSPGYSATTARLTSPAIWPIISTTGARTTCAGRHTTRRPRAKSLSGHRCAMPCRAMERWHQTMKNRVLLEHYFLPGDLERQVSAFVEYYNVQRYH